MEQSKAPKWQNSVIQLTYLIQLLKQGELELVKVLLITSLVAVKWEQ